LSGGIKAVDDQLTIEELQKASTNLNRIEEFLMVRSEWHLELDGFEALREIDNAAETMIRRIDATLDMIGRRTDWTLPTPPEPLPTSKFDSAQLAKLAGFMSQLSRWFDGHVGHEVEPGGEDHVGEIHKSLRTIRGGVEPIIDASPYRDSVPEQNPPSTDDPGHAATGTGGHPPAPPVAGPAPDPRRLVSQSGVAAVDRLILEDTDDNPITQTFRGDVELADSAKQTIAEFLLKHEVEYSVYRLHKFEDEVLRRVASTPEGQVLVLKIGGFQDNPNPFFSYVSKLINETATPGEPTTVESPYLGAPLPPAEDSAESAPQDGTSAEAETPEEPEAPSASESPSESKPAKKFDGDDSDLFHNNGRPS